MKPIEVKLKLVNSVNNLIDTYFGQPTVTEKMINATLKILVKQNAYKVDDVLAMFTDKNGEINPNDILAEYANVIGEEGFVIDIKEYVHNDMIRQFLPNKILVLKKEDILNLVR